MINPTVDCIEIESLSSRWELDLEDDSLISHCYVSYGNISISFECEILYVLNPPIGLLAHYCAHVACNLNGKIES